MIEPAAVAARRQESERQRARREKEAHARGSTISPPSSSDVHASLPADERRPQAEVRDLQRGSPLARVYTPADAPEKTSADRLGEPGMYPFTRGVQPTMYRGKLWTMRQYAGFGDARESNRRYKLLLEKGTTGLSIAFDSPHADGTRQADHPLAEGEVGKVGVAIDSLEDMERLFDGIPLDRVSTSMTITRPRRSCSRSTPRSPRSKACREEAARTCRTTS